MAKLYYRSVTDEEIKNCITVKVDANKVTSRVDWIYDIRVWCEENDIQLSWLGEHTVENGVNKWHEFDCAIPGEQQKALFLLRWS